MNKYQIQKSIQGASDAVNHINNAKNKTTDEINNLKSASHYASQGYIGASSSELNGKIASALNESSSQLQSLNTSISSINSIKNSLNSELIAIIRQEEAEARARAAEAQRQAQAQRQSQAQYSTRSSSTRGSW